MICPNCGSNNPDGAGFCPNCGKPLPANAIPPVQPQPHTAAAVQLCPHSAQQLRRCRHSPEKLALCIILSFVTLRVSTGLYWAVHPD